MAPAGAGKTQLAVKLLEEGIAHGERVVYINFTLNLADWIRKLPFVHKAHFIGTWHELACEAAGELPDNIPRDKLKDFYDNVSDRLLKNLNANRYEWDLIIVDDAQSLDGEWISALTNALDDIGSMYVLSDPYQTTAENNVEFSESLKITSNETARVPQRQAEEIAALKLTSGKFISQSPYVGEYSQVYGPYNNHRSLVRETEKAIEDAIKSGFRPEQIAILSMNSRSRSEILKLDQIGRHTLKKPLDTMKNGEQQFTQGEIYTDTVYRFKGLQAPYVIVTEIDFETMNQKEKAALYMAMTRCSMRLALVLSANALRTFTA